MFFARAAVSAVLLTACARLWRRVRPPPRRSPAGPSVDPATAGSVTATVKFEGTVPAPRDDAPHRRSQVRQRERRRGTRRRIAGRRREPGAAERVRLREGRPGQFRLSGSRRNRCCSTRTSAATRRACWACASASRWQIRNSDPLLHNVRSNGVINQGFNMSTPLEGVSFNRTFATKEIMVPFKCDVHAWMTAFVGVLDHPYFGTTAADGTGRARQPAAGHLHHRSVARDARHEDAAGHHRREGIEGCRIHLRTLTPAAAAHVKSHSRFGDYVTLTKPRLNFLVLLTVAAAYSLGARPDATLLDLVHTLARHLPRRRRRGGAQPGVGARDRSPDAAHRAAADGRRAHDGGRGHGVRAAADRDRRRGARLFRQPAVGGRWRSSPPRATCCFTRRSSCARRCRRSPAPCRARCPP